MGGDIPLLLRDRTMCSHGEGVPMDSSGTESVSIGKEHSLEKLPVNICSLFEFPCRGIEAE